MPLRRAKLISLLDAALIWRVELLSWEALEAERRTNTRTVHGFMTTRIPARALLNARRVVRTTDQDASAPDLLEMTFETEIRVARGEHLGIDAPMSVVTRRTTFFHCFVFENIRATLGGMTLKAIVLAR